MTTKTPLEDIWNNECLPLLPSFSEDEIDRLKESYFLGAATFYKILHESHKIDDIGRYQTLIKELKEFTSKMASELCQ